MGSCCCCCRCSDPCDTGGYRFVESSSDPGNDPVAFVSESIGCPDRTGQQPPLGTDDDDDDYYCHHRRHGNCYWYSWVVVLGPASRRNVDWSARHRLDNSQEEEDRPDDDYDDDDFHNEPVLFPLE